MRINESSTVDNGLKCNLEERAGFGGHHNMHPEDRVIKNNVIPEKKN